MNVDIWWNRCVLGSSERMSEIPDESVQCVVTSPPYLGLRDYGVDGQIGAEAKMGEYVERLCNVFDECRRVLRSDGTLFLNLGDSYSARPRGTDLGWDKSRLTNPARVQKAQAASLRQHTVARDLEIPAKNLMMIPARVAIALQDRGWYLRDDIIWHKPNPMPSSVHDRCSPSYEHIFMLTKNGSKPLLWRSKDTREFVSSPPDYTETITVEKDGVMVEVPRWESYDYYADMDAVRRPLTESSIARLEQPRLEQQAGSLRANGGVKTNGPMKAVARANAHNARYGVYEPASGNPDRNDGGRGRFAHDPAGANLKNVWSIETTGFPMVMYVCEHGHDFIERRPMGRDAEAAYRCLQCGAPIKRESHFATFPMELPARCIRMGSRVGDVVLDPFMGSGTVAEVAESLGRRWVGYELNPTYHRFIAERTRQAGLFSA